MVPVELLQNKTTAICEIVDVSYFVVIIWMEIIKQKYLITATRKVYKSFKNLPENIQERLAILLQQLSLQGPVAHKTGQITVS